MNHMLKISSSQQRATAQSGQALVVLLVFTVFGLIIISTAVALLITQTTGTLITQQSDQAASVAKSGVEDALLQLLRNPAYTGGEITIDNGAATVGVSGSNPIVIRSQGEVNVVKRNLEVEVNRINGRLVVKSWRELW